MKKHLLVYMGILCIFAIGCQGDKDQFVPYPLDGNISELIDELLGEPETILVPGNTSIAVEIDETFELLIDSNSFENEGDSEFNLNWTNAESSIKMELHDLPNYSNGKYLSPSFAFKLSNEEDIAINAEAPLELLIESEYLEDLALFQLSGEGWNELNPTEIIYNEWMSASGAAKSGYRITVESLGWYTIATKVDLASETFSNFCIELSGEYTQSNTKSFVILESNIAVPMSRSIDQGLFCTSMNIPIDQPIQIISMSNLRDGQYELDYIETQMENGLIIAPQLEEKTIEEIKLVLENI